MYFCPPPQPTQLPIMKKQKLVLNGFENVLQINKMKYHTYIRPFTQYFVEARLAAITALNLLGYESQISGRLKQVSLKNFPVFSAIHHSFNSDQFLSPC